MNGSSSGKGKWILLGLIIVVILSFKSLSSLYVDWLWYKSINLAQVFIVSLGTRWLLGLAVFFGVFLFFFINFLLTRRYSRADVPETTEDGREIIYPDPPAWEVFLRSRAATWIFVGVSLFIAWVAAMMVSSQWMVVQQYLHAVPFHVNDPIFHRDISFFIFNLAFYRLIYGLAMPVLVLSAIAVALIYMLTAAFDFANVSWTEFNWPKAHLITLLAMIFGLKAWGYSLSSYNILNSSVGVVYGAGYTDIHARLFAYKVLLVMSVLVAVMIILNLFIQRIQWVVSAIGLWVAAALLFSVLYPAAIQKLIVEPNEFNNEKPYILNNIKYTRLAYGLSDVDTRTFNTSNSLSWKDIEQNPQTIQNIRLWDWKPLKDTYKAIQEIRPYYTFNDIDIDRYMINGQYRQVMLAPRELSQMNLPVKAKTWVNERLIYTHGYGLAMSPVNEVAGEGLPVLFVRDIPPRSSIDLPISRPEVYYGEEASDYVIVNTNTREFDYPMGKTNADTLYQEKSGVPIGSLGRRLIMAYLFQDYKLLISPEIQDHSQVLIYRNIRERAERIAPFLSYDTDPYIVVDNGRMYWMMDAYTTSHMYPYSEPYDTGVNYVRNSVKITIDAYNGDIRFYIADPGDPILAAYAGTFPNLFEPMAKMPSGLQRHIRYPEGLFKVQAQMYAQYHMTDPWVFYNKEDKWNIPEEIVGSDTTEVSPYYLVMKLPDEEKAEYILMLPFTPNQKQNMIAWLCARSDAPNYGTLRVYDFSKQELIYGSMQVESRINQNSEISQQLTLWDQKGSRVYRGNLLTIPVNNAILYIEPIYLQASQSQIPELRRIVAVCGDKIVMEPTLEEAITRLFASGEQKTDMLLPPTGGVSLSAADLARSAKTYYDRAQEALKAGDWTSYGQNIKEVGRAIEQMIQNGGSKEPKK